MTLPQFLQDYPDHIFRRLGDLRAMLQDLEFYAVGTRSPDSNDALSAVATDLLITGVGVSHWTRSSRNCYAGPLANRIKTRATLQDASVTRLKTLFHAFAVQVGPGNASFACEVQDHPGHAEVWLAMKSQVFEAEKRMVQGQEECEAVLGLLSQVPNITTEQAERIAQHQTRIVEVHRIVEETMEADPIFLFGNGQFQVRISAITSRDYAQPKWSWMHGVHKLPIMTPLEIRQELDMLMAATEIPFSQSGITASEGFKDSLRYTSRVWPSLRFVLDFPRLESHCSLHLKDAYKIIMCVALRYAKAETPPCKDSGKILQDLRRLKNAHLKYHTPVKTGDGDGDSAAEEPKINSAPKAAGDNGKGGSDESRLNEMTPSQSSTAPLDTTAQNPYIPSQLSGLRAKVLKRKSQDEEAVNAQKKHCLDHEARIQQLGDKIESMGQELQKAQDLAAESTKRYDTAKATLENLQDRHKQLRTLREKDQTQHLKQKNQLHKQHDQLQTRHTQIQRKHEQQRFLADKLQKERDKAVSTSTVLQKQVQQMEEALRHTDETVKALSQALEDGGSS